MIAGVRAEVERHEERNLHRGSKPQPCQTLDFMQTSEVRENPASQALQWKGRCMQNELRTGKYLTIAVNESNKNPISSSGHSAVGVLDTLAPCCRKKPAV